MRRKKAESPATIPQQPLGIKKVRRTEEYQEAVKPEEERPVITIPAEVVEDEEPVDRFEEFFSRVRDQQGWTLLVYRLNSFDKDGKTDLRGNNTYMGRITFDPDSYLDDVQAMCPEGGAFKLQAKTPDNRYSEQWVEKVAPLKVTRAPGSTHYIIQPSANGNEVPEPPRDTLAEFLKSLKTVKEIKEVIGNGETPVREAIPVAATVEREPLQDRIIGAALESVFKSGKPETAEEILRAYIAPQREEGWTELIKELVKPLAPIVMNIIAAYMQGQAARAQAQGQVAQAQQAPQPQLPPQSNPQPWDQPLTVPPTSSMSFPLEIPQNAEPYDTLQPGMNPFAPSQTMMPTVTASSDEPLTFEEEEEMGRDDLVYSLAEMLEQCVRRAAADPNTIELGRLEVVKYKQRFPMMTGIIDALTTLPPEAIIGMLAMKVPEVAAMINNDVARQTILDFQAALRRPEVVQ